MDKKIIICGGGIMGCATAYYLAKRGVKVTVVERCAIACAASGKAGGFLAKDWCDHNELGTLARASFELHMGLAEQFPHCDYRRLDALEVAFRQGEASERRRAEELPAWVDGPAVRCSSIGDTSNTAQVHPYKLTSTFMDEAKRLAASEVVIGSVEGIEKSADGKITGVKVNGNILPADIIVFTMGPWTYQACDWLTIPPIRGSRAHSIVMRPKHDVSAHSLFTDFAVGGPRRSPEIYPRPDGTVYACGFSDSVAMPADPSKVSPNKDSCGQLKDICATISSNLADATVEAQQACYLPTPPGHLPIIGKLPHIEDAYMASGHTCWGILSAPGTGAALAELIVEGECKLLDLSPFAPGNFM